jgi:BlaR1 peptidase M56/Gram-negative bacterial TonB protein C-terminal
MLTYFLQVNLCWLMFYGLYYALLSRETFFKLNRIYLIISLLCGLVIPFSMLYFRVEPDNPAVIVLQPFIVSASLLQQGVAQAETWSVWGVLKVLYGIGGAVLGVRFLIGLLKIWGIYRKGEKTLFSDFTLVNTEGVFNPFSFLKWIFINPKTTQDTDFEHIILHEKAHVTQKHSYDVVFLQFLNVVFWWSPIVYFYKKSLINVHEYLADEAVLKTTTPPQYGRLLLRQMQSGMQPALANNFISQLKKRILMMTRNPSQRTALLRYTLALPLFLMLVGFFVAPNNPMMAKTEALSEKVETSIKVLDESIKANLNEKPLKIVENKTLTSPIVNTIYDDKPLTFELDGGYKGGVITSYEFKKQKAIVAFEVVKGKKIYWKIESFVALRIPRWDDILQANSKKGEFEGEVTRIIEQAKNNDSYQFQAIKVFDEKNNKVVPIGTMSFIIKDDVSEKPVEKSDTLIQPFKKLKEVKTEDVEKIDIKKASGQTAIVLTKKDGTIFKFEGTDEEVKAYLNESKTENLYDVSPAVKDYNAINSTLPKETHQTQIRIIQKEQPVFTIVEQMPEFEGGQYAMFKFLSQNVKYPQEARKRGIEGSVYVGFIVETDGSISNIEIKREKAEVAGNKTSEVVVVALGEKVTGYPKDSLKIVEGNGVIGYKLVNSPAEGSLGREAKRVVAAMPKWKPGKQNGKVVRTSYTIPIKFKME